MRRRDILDVLGKREKSVEKAFTNMYLILRTKVTKTNRKKVDFL